MNNPRSLTLALCLGGMLAWGSALADGDPEAGRAKALSCMGCHGIPGYFTVYPTYKVPKLAGQHPEFLVAALMAYKNGERSHKTMVAQATSLSEADMQDIAAYFAAMSGEGK
jgi:cytochrome c553